ncbi:hypothetical protein EDC01DRAFT_467883 [Geopyxis carbonaria]|nr:hypothetical protein EDC01DRAFT_467883 [Geopyxis carbonaria]
MRGRAWRRHGAVHMSVFRVPMIAGCNTACPSRGGDDGKRVSRKSHPKRFLLRECGVFMEPTAVGLWLMHPYSLTVCLRVPLIGLCLNLTGTCMAWATTATSHAKTHNICRTRPDVENRLWCATYGTAYLWLGRYVTPALARSGTLRESQVSPLSLGRAGRLNSQLLRPPSVSVHRLPVHWLPAKRNLRQTDSLIKEAYIRRSHKFD